MSAAPTCSILTLPFTILHNVSGGCVAPVPPRKLFGGTGKELWKYH